ncbi:sensor histidine kinase [Rhodococcus sp. BP-149]|jgi:signal transduction histidine kinase|uniref:sensor histidine kinase n=1 Tax=unclassified Rhodococcus (in: high G+C Gram-positive bacteria) TaxID=192944 RepID=UPI001C9BB6D8|nr:MULTISPECIES: histidine kinase [unclassified Rhodococcus (in: high G+C Gram-positive bacteria)]MBY6686909.1 sensor histidine kinase [Rhodococcus sp. BP-288]MBY6694038.1 sensor histidine kinase [Rhodococcus sp. BP-188]MBY6699021.1 sensor histidine kinase [Rhodococcus sp. BP-285]MBY6702629.1 sensor histidine kinase [Rhodococcus sp. BP-283]MBY6711791.1 sensor histidine kinase [Rhodococcus sp. BP-160]
MRRFSEWLRHRPFAVDCALAVSLFLIELTAVAAVQQPLVYVAMAVAVSTPIAWRRRYPVAAAWTALALGQVATLMVWASEEPRTLPPGQLGFVVMLYTLAVYTDRRTTLLFALGLAADIVVVRLVLGSDWTSTIFFVLLYALAYITAEFLGTRRAYVAEVSARLAVAESDRDRRAVEAVSAERTRIARELHDVVAHAVSVMIVQADGASYALRSDPERAAAALANISATGRTALTELRRTVSLLRTDESSESHPEYGTAALAKIVELMRAAGLRVSIEQTGELDDLPPAVSLGVHRLVQESLTNVLRHGGERPRAVVAVRREPSAVTVSVINSSDDTGPAVDIHAAPTTSGFGVIGMRERVAVLGGELRAGPLPDGRWRVAATLPLELKAALGVDQDHPDR